MRTKQLSPQFVLMLLGMFIASIASAQKTITFLSPDNLIVTADLYKVSDSLPYMILCHQAGSSRGEYKETARKFTKLGYNCIAVDLRSGDKMNGVEDETASLAEAKELPVNFLASKNDIIAAIDYAYRQSGKQVILVGSAFSASLDLVIAKSNSKVRAVMAFSPGEYFGKKLNVEQAIQGLNKPVFVASTRAEAPKVTTLMSGVKSTIKQQFTPPTKGVHGSEALWESDPDYHGYWIGILMFMRQIDYVN